MNFVIRAFVFSSLLTTLLALQRQRGTSALRDARLRSSLTNHGPMTSKQITEQQISDVLKLAARSTAVLGFAQTVFADDGASGSEDEYAIYKSTGSGLRYLDTVVGTGATPLPGDTVKVHYTGWLDGFESEKKFDSSYDRRSPLSFKVGVRQVIAGWDEGLLTDLKVGGKRNLIIPADLGYGSRGAGGIIPPNATLFFKIELVSVVPK